MSKPTYRALAFLAALLTTAAFVLPGCRGGPPHPHGRPPLPGDVLGRPPKPPFAD